jgi:DNA segregation ATPase FtsK/SpoIIIE-like protein
MKKVNIVKKDVDIKALVMVIETTLESFGITARVCDVTKSSTEIDFHLEVALGTNIKEIKKVDSSLAMALCSPTGKIQIQAPIPGLALVGIKLPISSSIEAKVVNEKYKIVEIQKVYYKALVPELKVATIKTLTKLIGLLNGWREAITIQENMDMGNRVGKK